jgi:carbon storage regulator
MRRREGECILIGDEVKIHILSINGSRVKFGISAPRSIRVLTQEMELVQSENEAAASASSTAPAAILAALMQRNYFEKRPEESRQPANKISED